jgi:Ser/Thr protein kinase RdoA (MazF antagonist)
MAHGYSNRVIRQGDVVTKSYLGPGAAQRCAREAAALAGLAGKLPVPPVITASARTLRAGWLRGIHGQDLIAAGQAPAVLRACGDMLRRVQAISPAVAGATGPGGVLVHGDYGPNNLLFGPAGERVTAIVDWEWVHSGGPVEDLAWSEWIIRMHHPGDAGSLGELFSGYGSCPPWAARHQAMVSRCHYYLRLTRRQDAAAQRWQERLAITQSWAE